MKVEKDAAGTVTVDRRESIMNQEELSKNCSPSKTRLEKLGKGLTACSAYL